MPLMLPVHLVPSTLLLFSPTLPLGALLLVAATELGVVVALGLWNRGGLAGLGRGGIDIDEVARVLGGELELADEVSKVLIGGVDELDGGETAAVLDPRVRAGLEHHLDERTAEFALLGGLRVEPTNGGVERGVLVDSGEGIALKLGLVEEEVDDLV
jgi:hypothetical protein